MKNIILRSFYLATIDMFFSCIIYIISGFNGATTPIAVIRFIFLIITSLVVFLALKKIVKSTLIYYLSSFLLIYFLIIIIFTSIGSNNIGVFNQIVLIHQNIELFVLLQLPFILAAISYGALCYLGIFSKNIH